MRFSFNRSRDAVLAAASVLVVAGIHQTFAQTLNTTEVVIAAGSGVDLTNGTVSVVSGQADGFPQSIPAGANRSFLLNSDTPAQYQVQFQYFVGSDASKVVSFHAFIDAENGMNKCTDTKPSNISVAINECNHANIEMRVSEN